MWLRAQCSQEPLGRDARCGVYGSWGGRLGGSLLQEGQNKQRTRSHKSLHNEMPAGATEAAVWCGERNWAGVGWFRRQDQRANVPWLCRSGTAPLLCQGTWTWPSGEQHPQGVPLKSTFLALWAAEKSLKCGAIRHWMEWKPCPPHSSHPKI